MTKSSEQVYELVDIKILKGKVKLVFYSFELDISRRSYLSLYVYPGKKISQEEIDRLKDEYEEDKAVSLLERRLARKRISEKEALDFLIDKGLAYNKAKTYISSYVESSLIDDHLFAEDFVIDRKEKNWGKKRIEKELLRRKIPKEIIESKRISMLLSEDRISDSFLLSLSNRYSRYSSRAKERKMTEQLVQLGHEFDTASERVHSFLSEREEEEKEKDRSLLYKEALSCYNTLSGRKDFDVKKKNRLFLEKLLRKGFLLEDIIRVRNERSYLFK